MGDQSIAETYSRVAPAFDRTGPRFFSHFGRRLVEWAKIPEGADVLDVATGRGAILFPAAQHVGANGHVIGVDLSAGMVREVAADLAGAGLKQAAICQMDARVLAFPTASFDYLLCGHAIYYFTGAIGEFHRVLRPGGHVGLTIVARGCLDWILELLESYAPDPDSQDENEEQEALNTPAGLERLLSSAGFGDIQIAEQEARLPYADEDAWWATMWAMGCRATMERMSPATLDRFRQDVFRELQAFRQPGGIEIPFCVLCAMGAK
jgi:O-methyltransferase / aklanonic acid methyltransferase